MINKLLIKNFVLFFLFHQKKISISLFYFKKLKKIKISYLKKKKKNLFLFKQKRIIIQNNKIFIY